MNIPYYQWKLFPSSFFTEAPLICLPITSCQYANFKFHNSCVGSRPANKPISIPQDPLNLSFNQRTNQDQPMLRRTILARTTNIKQSKNKGTINTNELSGSASKWPTSTVKERRKSLLIRCLQDTRYLRSYHPLNRLNNEARTAYIHAWIALATVRVQFIH